MKYKINYAIIISIILTSNISAFLRKNFEKKQQYGSVRILSRTQNISKHPNSLIERTRQGEPKRPLSTPPKSQQKMPQLSKSFSTDFSNPALEEYYYLQKQHYPTIKTAYYCYSSKLTPKITQDNHKTDEPDIWDEETGELDTNKLIIYVFQQFE